MRFARTRLSQRLKQRAMAVGAAALVLPVAAGVAGGAVAVAAPAHAAPVHTAPSGGYEELWVPSSMGNIKVQVQWAARGGSAALYLLDGLRARNDRNAWSFETNALDQYRNDNVTLVMPVGGESSFYSDWYAPSNFNGQPVTYKWETFLTQELPNFLANYGVSRTNNAVLGLSMGGSAALTLAAYHRDQFKFAGSLSGYLNISAPGMREAIRVAMLDAGRFNVDAMWGPPWNPAWLRNDPFVFANKLRDNGTRVWVSAANGIPAPGGAAPTGVMDVFNATTGASLEALSLANTRAFQVRMATIGAKNVTYSFPPRGIHSWRYWQQQIHDLAPDLSNTIG
jgi:diacylglycerol O-acyltransferase/trehalose O-mycolyltransferase